MSVAVLLLGELRLTSCAHFTEWSVRLQCSQVFVATWPEYAAVGNMLTGSRSKVQTIPRPHTSGFPSTNRVNRSYPLMQWKLLSVALNAFQDSFLAHDVIIKARTDLLLPIEFALFANRLGRSAQKISDAVHLANDLLFYAPPHLFVRVLGDFFNASETLYMNTNPPCNVWLPKVLQMPNSSLGNSRSYGQGKCRFRPRMCYNSDGPFMVGPSWFWPGSVHPRGLRFSSSIALCYHILWHHNIATLPLAAGLNPMPSKSFLDSGRYNMTWGMQSAHSTWECTSV